MLSPSPMHTPVCKPSHHAKHALRVKMDIAKCPARALCRWPLLAWKKQRDHVRTADKSHLADMHARRIWP